MKNNANCIIIHPTLVSLLISSVQVYVRKAEHCSLGKKDTQANQCLKKKYKKHCTIKKSTAVNRDPKLKRFQKCYYHHIEVLLSFKCYK